jgi:hypothetical protein
MPRDKLDFSQRRGFIVMLRFMNKHKAVIQQAAKESGCKDVSTWIRRIVWPHVSPYLDKEGNPLEYGPTPPIKQVTLDEEPY